MSPLEQELAQLKAMQLALQRDLAKRYASMNYQQVKEVDERARKLKARITRIQNQVDRQKQGKQK